MNTNPAILFAFICIQQCINGATSLATLPEKEEVIVKKSFCALVRVHRMLAYDCSNMELKDVPQKLRPGVQVFDLSYNRIREITKESFAIYTDIVFLYLQDNMIDYIEENSFAHLTSLEAIDLSINTLHSISMDLFQLPRLRNLYYSENGLTHLEKDLKKLQKPIAAPLQKLFLADCRLSSIPDFGILPELVQLNVSFNKFDEIMPQQFSPLCQLSKIDIKNCTKINPCMCKTLTDYFNRRNIFIIDYFGCPRMHEEEVYCADTVNATIDTQHFEICLSKVKDKERDEKAKKTWFSIICILAAFFVTFICILYYFHRRNVQRIKLEEKQAVKLHHVHQTDVGNVEVLLNAKT